MYDIVIIGGGLAGLCSAIALGREGMRVCLIEKKKYPFHRVCGEYVSNEALPYLKKLHAGIELLPTVPITRFILSSPKGKTLECPLDLGGFGISRYMLDEHLYRIALQAGAEVQTGVQVNDVSFADDRHTLALSNGKSMYANVVVGSFGKRSKLDRALDRDFFKARSPYIGIKYHIKGDLAIDTVALHNFEDGYCGINSIENDSFCLCYLTTRENLRKHGAIPGMEKAILHKNPILKEVFTQSEFLYDKPEVINEVSFAVKEAVKDHILMAGDAAGMIAPLCGNGMAMAIHGAKIASEEIIKYFHSKPDRRKMEEAYARRWKAQFHNRLRTGRAVQGLFGKSMLSEAVVGMMKYSPTLVRQLMRRTHGQPF